jgi:deoxyribodipyrimidine photo-lyase
MREAVLRSRSAIPTIRVRAANERPPRADGDFVLYWMTACRRTRYNFALQRAVEWARELDKPLLVLEALRVDYAWASDRFHRFILDGMADNRSACAAADVTYFPYVEPSAGAGKGLLAALAARSCIVVTDDYPAFFLPAALRAAAKQVVVAMEAVDSNGLHALAAPGRVFDTAFAFRRWLQQNILGDLLAPPLAEPLLAAPRLRAVLPADLSARWPLADLERGAERIISALPVDHAVVDVPLRGGSQAATKRLDAFVRAGLSRYADKRNDVVASASSGLSPYLHFGHISPHEVFDAVSRHEAWCIDRAGGEQRGKRTGFWGMSAAAEAFLDQLITWRELGFNFCAYRSDYEHFDSLPDWARRTLERHERDPRPHLYRTEQMERAETSDAVWNAAQTQLVREGRIHSYLRMLWGKRILEWTASPREALATMIHLNNKYALDGRDPNSYSGIFWTLGRYDRPWGPERPIFGTVRYMSSVRTRRKLKLGDYLARFGQGAAA